ncbi:MAG: AAA family ATPase, partial [Lentisphaeria bacterium]
DPRYIFRRMIISSVEDVGMANPQAMQYVQTAADAFDRIGMPEGNFLLANAAIYLATSPKSNSALAFFDALKVVRDERDSEVPNHLRDASRDKEGFGHGAGYQYPHAYRDHWVVQQYLPDSLQGRIFYNPGCLGYEKSISDDVNRRREEQLAAMLNGNFFDAPPEILSFSPSDKEFDRWVQRTINQTGNYLREIREHLFEPIKMQRHFRVLVLNDDSGLLTWESLRVVPEGGVWSLLQNKKMIELIKAQCLAFHEDDSIQLRLPQLILYKAPHLLELIDSSINFEVMVVRNFFQNFTNIGAAIDTLLAKLVDDGQISFAETLPATATRLSTFINWPNNDLKHQVEAAENIIYARYNYDSKSLQNELIADGRLSFLFDSRILQRPLQINSQMLNKWFDENNNQSYVNVLKQSLANEDLLQVRTLFNRQLLDKTVMMKTTTLFGLAKNKMVKKNA